MPIFITKIKKYKKSIIIILGILILIAVIIRIYLTVSVAKAEFIHYDDFKTPTRYVTYTYRNDKIIKQNTTVSTSYINKRDDKHSDITDKLKNISGIRTTKKYEKSVIFETIEVNFNKLSKNNLNRYQEIMSEIDTPITTDLNLKNSTKLLEKQGFLTAEKYQELKEDKEDWVI